MLRQALRNATASTSRLVATPALSASARPALAQASRAAPQLTQSRLYHEKVIDHVGIPGGDIIARRLCRKVSSDPLDYD